MHGQNLRQAQNPRGGGTVHTHREFVAVNDIDSMSPQKAQQIPYSSGIDRPTQMINLWSKAVKAEECLRYALSLLLGLSLWTILALLIIV